MSAARTLPEEPDELQVAVTALEIAERGSDAAKAKVEARLLAALAAKDAVRAAIVELQWWVQAVEEGTRRVEQLRIERPRGGFRGGEPAYVLEARARSIR